MSGTTPEKKKQAKSEVMYRITMSGTAPEKKKQAKSEVMYRIRETHKIAGRTGEANRRYVDKCLFFSYT